LFPSLNEEFKFPIVSTSINLSGEAAAIERSDIDPYFLTAADYVCDLNEIGTGKPSSIIKLGINGTFEFIRK